MAMVVFLSFGSLTDENDHWHTAREVFLRMGVKDGAQWNIIKRWRERGYKIESHLHDRGKSKMLSEE